MRHLSVALALALALVALPAWGATYHVRQNAFGDGSGSDNANSMAIATFNALGSGGNVALLHGTFTTVPSPTANGTMAAPTTYRNGATNNSRDSVSFGIPGANIDFYLPGTSAARHVWYRDFTIRGRVYIGTYHAATTTSRIRMSNIRIVDGYMTFYRIDDCKFDSLNLTIPVSTAYPHGGTVQWGSADKTPTGVGTDSVYYCSRDTMSNCTFNNAAAMVQTVSEGAPAACYMWSGRDMVYQSLRCSLTTANTYQAGAETRFSRVLQTQGGKMDNCFFYGYWTPGGAGTNEPMTWSLKDGCRFFTINNCTVVLDGASLGSYPNIAFAWDETNGQTWQLPEAIGGNKIRNSYFKNLTASTLPINWYTNSTDGDSIAYNTFVTGSSSNVMVNSYARGNGNAVDRVTTGNTVFDHNIFVTWYTGGPAFTIGNAVTAEQSIKWTNNVFVNMAATSAGRGAYFGDAAGWPDNTYGPVGNDYNVFYVPNAASHAQLAWSGGTVVPNDTAWSALRGLTNDAHSIYGTCLFADTARATFDAHPLTGSAIDFGGGVFAGPYAIAGVTQHTITASAGANGTISPSGAVVVTDGTSQTFTFSPSSGYRIASVTVDAVVVGTPTSYTFTGNAADHTIAVAFEQDSYAIYSQAFANGTISPSGTTNVVTGSLKSYEITPNASYRVVDVLVDGASVGAVTSYTFTNVRAVHSIEAYFALETSFTIVASAGVGGSISPSGSVSVDADADQSFTMTPNAGYHLASVTVDGVAQAVASPYEFTVVNENHTISCTFARDNISIVTITAAGNGSVSYEGSSNSGGTVMVHARPSAGYRTSNMVVDGVSLGVVTDYVFKNLATDHVVSVYFKTCPENFVESWKGKR